MTGLELGAEDYITKPFGVRELQARIQTALRRLPAEPEKLTEALAGVEGIRRFSLIEYDNEDIV